MLYIIIILIVINTIISIISLTKNISEGKITERLGKLETSTTKNLADFL